MDESESNELTSNYPEFSYCLRYVPFSLNHEDLKYNLSYYGQIKLIQKIDNLPSIQRDVLITFDKHVRINLLNHIWAVNIRGHNISLAKAQYTDTQLEYHKLHIIGFKGFNYKTTESQALRVFRPYGGMLCQFHQNIAYIAFKTADQMHSICYFRLYTDDDRLLTGHLRICWKGDSSILLPKINSTRPIKAMSTQTSALPDLNSSTLHNKKTPHK